MTNMKTLLIWCLLATLSYSKMSQKELMALSEEATLYFRQGTQYSSTNTEMANKFFLKSALRYERILKEGKVKNGYLYYNLGNANFKAGRLGDAIVNYLQAQKYLPDDRNLKGNLAFARHKADSPKAQEKKKSIMQQLFFPHYKLQINTKMQVLIFTFTLFWGMLIASLFISVSSFKWILPLFGSIAAVFAVSLYLDLRSQSSKVMGVVTGSDVIARKGDSISYEASFTEPLQEGTEFTVLEMRNHWLLATLSDGQTCWMPKKKITLVQ